MAPTPGPPHSSCAKRKTRLYDPAGEARHVWADARRPYQEPGERVRYAYVLTKAGGDLATTFVALTQWGEEHVLKERAPIETVERSTGQLLRAELINEQGDVVDASRATLAQRKNNASIDG